MRLSRVWRISLGCMAVVLFLATGAWAVTIQQLSTTDGKTLRITGWDNNAENTFEGYEVDLRIYTPAFTGDIVVPGLHSTILVVQDGKVTQNLPPTGAVLPAAPAIPADGYIVIGSGLASTHFLIHFPVGSEVKIIEKESKAQVPAPTVVVTLSGGSKPLSAIDRGRMTYELILYTPDFGSHTYTNQYGAEVVVIDGIIVAKRPYGNTDLQPIPEDGYVLSGHNIMGTWLNTLPIGDLVELQ
ncbi:MAG TPA: hypothetical protein GXZ82_12140 [Firmicutes bacterium]|jgi:hypothetical protein|nr:hypothetical protein [Bacillota bacterium]